MESRMQTQDLKVKAASLPSVLLASSSEGLDVARALEVQLKSFAQTTTWKDGPFGLSSANLESLAAAASQFDFAVIVFTPDDQVQSRGNSFPGAPRDNTVFELGFFMGALGRHRSFVVYCEDDPIKLPTDLAGVTGATFKRSGNLISDLGPVATALREAMKKAPPRTGATFPMLEGIGQRLASSHQQRRVMSSLEELPGISDLSVWPENRPEVEKISDLLVQFEDRDWGERTFVIFFGQHSSRPITIYQLFETLATLEPAKLYLCLENVERILSKSSDHPVSYLSIRDLFERHTEKEFAEVHELFSRNHLLRPVHRAPEDVKQHPDGRKARQVKYGGLVPSGLSLEDLSLAADMMKEVRLLGTEVIRSGLTFSPTHIVISRWSPAQSPWMIVTATNSDKSRLLLFAETPIVTQMGEALVYFGDPSKPPSSEAVPHWIIHRNLHGAGCSMWSCILHVHSDPLNTLAEQGDVMLNEGIFLPTVPHIEYGTERMGRMLAETMIHSKTAAASVQHHGQWFVAQSFDDALQQAVRAHEAALIKLRAEGS